MKKSTKNQIKAEFFEFLRENDCASKFCVNFYNKKGRGYGYGRGIPGNTVTEHINKEIPKNWILEAFEWDETIQGHNYWSKMHYKWKTHVEAIKYNIQKSKDETNSH